MTTGVDHRDRTRSPLRQRVERRHAGDRKIQRQSETARGGKPDAHSGEAARADPDREQVEVAWDDSCGAQQPIRVGKHELHGLLERWIPRLDERADAWLVVQRNLGSDSLQRWLAATFERGYSVQRAATGRGFRVIKVRRHGSPPSEPIDLP